MDLAALESLGQTKTANITELEEMNKEADAMLKQKEKELKAYSETVRDAERILKELQDTVNEKTIELRSLQSPDENAINERRLVVDKGYKRIRVHSAVGKKGRKAGFDIALSELCKALEDCRVLPRRRHRVAAAGGREDRRCSGESDAARQCGNPGWIPDGHRARFRRQAVPVSSPIRSDNPPAARRPA